MRNVENIIENMNKAAVNAEIQSIIDQLLPKADPETLASFLIETANNAHLDNMLTCLKMEHIVVCPIDQVEDFVNHCLENGITPNGGTFVFNEHSVEAQYLYI